jgi:hypothetical protein
MTIQEMMERHDIFDGAIVHHGFNDALRDYELVTEMYEPGANPAEPSRIRAMVTARFLGCVECHYETAVPDLAWAPSLDAAGLPNDVFVDFDRWEAAGSPDGYVWGVKYAAAYPGWTYINASPRAEFCSRRLGVAMHEVLIETNVFRLSIVFHALSVTEDLPTSNDRLTPRLSP